MPNYSENHGSPLVLMYCSVKNQVLWAFQTGFHSCCVLLWFLLLFDCNCFSPLKCRYLHWSNKEALVTSSVLLVLSDIVQPIATVHLCNYTWFSINLLCPSYISSIFFEMLLSALLRIAYTASPASLCPFILYFCQNIKSSLSNMDFEVWGVFSYKVKLWCKHPCIISELYSPGDT